MAAAPSRRAQLRLAVVATTPSAPDRFSAAPVIAAAGDAHDPRSWLPSTRPDGTSMQQVPCGRLTVPRVVERSVETACETAIIPSQTCHKTHVPLGGFSV